MKRPKTVDITPGELCWTLSSIMLLGFLLGWGFFSGGGWIEALAKSPSAPEWVQGIGSLVGIGIAIYVPWNQRRNEAFERADRDRRQARALAVRLRKPLEDWIGEFDRFLSEIDRSDAPASHREMIRVGARSDSIFGSSKAIEENIDELFLLGAAGDYIFDALRKAHEANATCNVLYTEIGLSPARDLAVYESSQFAGIVEKFNSIQDDIAYALDGVVETL